MAKRNHRLQKACAHAGCKETAFWNCSTWEEYNRINADNREWKCLRHSSPEQILSATNNTIQALTVEQKEHGRYFNGQSGFVSGPGFMAYAADFPPGTKLTVTATIELPKD